MPRLTIDISSDTHAWLCQQSSRDEIPIAGVIRRLIREARKADGTLPPIEPVAAPRAAHVTGIAPVADQEPSWDDEMDAEYERDRAAGRA